MPPKVVRRQIGGAWYTGIWSGLKKAYDFVKDKKLVSTVAKAVGQDGVAKVAGQLGLGRKKRSNQTAGAKRKAKKAIRFS
jgi:hypothetical protein